jgi:hypothetical protein
LDENGNPSCIDNYKKKGLHMMQIALSRFTVASLLGYSGLKHTEKYTCAVDKLKEDAINSLPELRL